MKSGLRRLIALLLVFAIMLPLFQREEDKVYAGTWDNAKTYYNKYGNSAVFNATNKTNGNVYFCSKGNSSNAKIKYKLIGWKMFIKDLKGNTIQKIYFKLGGNYLVLDDTRESGGYSYALYSFTLYTLKQRMSKKAYDALKNGKCSISLNACMTTIVNGKVQGSMNDNGTFSGKVYTTYKGITGAANWSQKARGALKTYFGKGVKGLFYKVSVDKSLGISSVSGGGTYCFGNHISIEAVVASGYIFDKWKGLGNVSSEKHSFYVAKDSSWIAYAKPAVTVVFYHRNSNNSDFKTVSESYMKGTEKMTLMYSKWQKSGYHTEGWKLDVSKNTADYKQGQQVDGKWIMDHYPRVDLYSAWKPNVYKIVYEGHLVKELSPEYVNYESEVKLKGNGDFKGWSLNPLAKNAEYEGGGTFAASVLAARSNLLNTNNGVIHLYAIWESEPQIMAEDLYYSLKDAKSGYITESELAGHFKAYDSKDGDIEYGQHKDNSFLITNYDGKVFVNLEDENQVPIKLRVTNSMGKTAKKEILVHIADCEVKDDEDTKGNVRFISDKYYYDGEILRSEDTGGVKRNSCWRKSEECRKLLVKALNCQL